MATMTIPQTTLDQATPRPTDPLLDIRGLKTHFFTRTGVVKVLDGLDLQVGRGEILGLVGESGSGKSVTGFSIVGLLKRPGWIVGGEITFEGRDLTTLPPEAMQELRGKQISMIFQNPRSSLNPVIPIGKQLAQVLQYRRDLKGKAAWEAAVDMLRTVHIPEPERRMRAYPHQLSGGMAQRVMIAMAISCSPKLLIADEPTTGLDVTIEYQIIHLLKEMRDLTGTSVVVITHDLNMAAEVCDRIAVMYAGTIVEDAPVQDFFTAPRHPYTVGLLASRPHLAVEDEIPTIPGNVPDLITRPIGCPFHPRCRWGTNVCVEQFPPLRPVGPRHFAACHYAEEVARDVVAAG
ncbi:MAG: ABC transporter ATP-binding protein [Chloroflexota bacterium]|nr:ABC transporter ATP-binding protein [Chloroflexota bacterium]